MFKTLTKSVILFFLLLVNIALFTWCVNQLELGQPLEKTLISDVEANVTHDKPQYVPRVEVVAPTAQQPTSSDLAPKSKQNRQLVLQFQSTQNRITQQERVKLEGMLQRLNIKTDHSVQIFSGTAASKNNVQSPQIAKLRAQGVARVVYPYTQTVKMHYRPSLEEGKVIVEFLEPDDAVSQ